MVECFFGEVHAAFQPCHGPHEPRPVVFGEPFFAAEACELAAVADVLAGVVFRGRCPARDDVFDAYQFVFVAVSAEDAESTICHDNVSSIFSRFSESFILTR